MTLVSLVRFLLRYYRRHAWWIAVAVLTIPIYGAASAALVALIDPVFSDVLLAGRPAVSAAAGSPLAGLPDVADRGAGLKRAFDGLYAGIKQVAGIDERSVVIFTPLLAFVVFLVRAAANLLGQYAFHRVGVGITTTLRNDLCGRLLDQDARFHATHPTGELVSRVTSDVGLMQSGLSSRLFDVAQQSVALVLLLALLFSTDAALASSVLLVAPLFVFILSRFGKEARRAGRQAQVGMADVTRVLLEGLAGHQVVKAFSGEAHEQARFKAATARHFAVTLRGRLLEALSSGAVETLAIASTAAFLVYAGLRVRSGHLSVPLLIQFIANVWLLYDPVRRLNAANMALQPLVAAGQRIQSVLQWPITVVERPGARKLDMFRDRIAFENVTVRYGGRAVVKGVSVDVRRGEAVAIVGASGAGKTTLTSLLPRFFDPDEGRVTIDGHDVRDLTISSLRAQVGMVTQHTVLFDDTIRNNIAYASPHASLDAVTRAAEAAFAADFIRATPGGYDAMVGENGHRLSGGERQRIAIARAILKDAPILILDEATSQLDSAAETLVHRALQNLMKGRTVLIIAHHLATVHEASRIVVLHDGALVDSGRHDELLVRCDTYRHLFRHWMADDD
jgi:subfamily B ATP-binding cassette protein MsbA